jgi:hypothetical protein
MWFTQRDGYEQRNALESVRGDADQVYDRYPSAGFVHGSDMLLDSAAPGFGGACRGVPCPERMVWRAGRGRGRDMATLISLIFAGELAGAA